MEAQPGTLIRLEIIFQRAGKIFDAVLGHKPAAAVIVGRLDDLGVLFDHRVDDLHEGTQQSQNLAALADAVDPQALLVHVPVRNVVKSGDAGAVEGVDAADFRTGIACVLGEAAADFNVVLIDCPPALGLLTLNSLSWADHVLVPLQAEFFALEGLAFLLRTLDRVKRSANDRLSLLGVVLTMYDGRNNLAQQVEKDVRHHLHGRVFDAKIPRNVRLSEAPSHALPIFDYDARSAGAQAYAALSDEVIAALKL